VRSTNPGRARAVIIDPIPGDDLRSEYGEGKPGRLTSVRAPCSAEAVISGHTAVRFVVPPERHEHESE